MNIRVQIVDLSSGLFVIIERMLTIQYDRRDQSPGDLHIKTENCWRSQREAHSGYEDDLAGAWCKERGWGYHAAGNITGCEAKCVVLLDCGLVPEWITRGINMLIIVTWLL